MSLTEYPTDAKPIPLFVIAETLPATFVPWTWFKRNGIGLLSPIATS